MYEEYTLIGYGCGNNFFPYLERLDQIVTIEYFSDKKKSITGKKIYGDKRVCIAPEEILNLKNPLVVILVDEIENINQIKKFLEDRKVPYLHAREVLETNRKKEEITSVQWLDKIQNSKIHRFIDLNISGTTTCNFHCEYCYVWRRQGFKGEHKLSDYSVAELCNGLSRERTGGVCFINLCARGETLLADGIVELVKGLLKEGHYVSVVTNATITKQINEILALPDELIKRMFFKVSFHYKELKRLSIFELFWNNIKNIQNSCCSFTLELTPGDGSELLIDEIKKICVEEMDGLLPHISFTRDSKKVGYDLLSEHSIDEYRRIWSQFESKMFNLKSEWYGVNMKKYNCYAGTWSYLVDAVSGDIKACYQQPLIGNIFDRTTTSFPVEAVGKNCAVAYCFNNHAFLAWGTIPQITCDTYLEMRDRVTWMDKHWVKEPFYSFMSQKLQDNNFEYIDRWSDYEKLYIKNRKKAFVLFNSPDYLNLGDHAIALAERKFFTKYFQEYDFIEVSCMQYIKENARIKAAIGQEDVLLISGGGYTGNIYLRLQDITSHIIHTYQNNSIIVCPQTMFFDGETFQDSEKNRMKFIYENHKHLMLVARDIKTFHLYDALFGSKIEKKQIPDMAFYLKVDYVESRQGALVCLRKDKESKNVASTKEVKTLLKKYVSFVSEYSTISAVPIMLDNREEKVEEAIRQIAKAEFVITDRLHCMIFCIITNTPCIVMDNTTGKVFDIFHTLQLNETVVSCKSLSELEMIVQTFSKNKTNKTINLEQINNNIENFSKEVDQFIKTKKLV